MNLLPSAGSLPGPDHHARRPLGHCYAKPLAPANSGDCWLTWGQHPAVAQLAAKPQRGPQLFGEVNVPGWLKVWFYMMLFFWVKRIQPYTKPLQSNTQDVGSCLFGYPMLPRLFAKGQSCRQGNGPEAPRFVIANAAPNQRCHYLTAMKIQLERPPQLQLVNLVNLFFFTKTCSTPYRWWYFWSQVHRVGVWIRPQSQSPNSSSFRSPKRGSLPPCPQTSKRTFLASTRGASRSSQSSWNSHDCGGTVQPKRWKALPNAFPVVQTHWHAMNPASGWKEWSHKSKSASMPCPIVSLKTFRYTFGQDNVGAKITRTTPTTIHSRAESCNSASRCLHIARLDLGKTLQRVAWQGSPSFKKTYIFQYISEKNSHDSTRRSWCKSNMHLNHFWMGHKIRLTSTLPFY